MAKKRRSNSRNSQVEALQLALVNNGKAIEEGNKQKHWSKHDLKQVKPLTPTQDDMFHGTPPDAQAS